MKDAAPTRARLPARVARWGFFAVALVLGTGLLVSSITSYLGARALLETVIEGQAEAAHRELRQYLQPGRRHGPPHEDELRRFLEDNADEGVVYVAVMGPGGEPLVAAGTPSDPRPLRPGELRILGDHVQAAFPGEPPGGPPGDPAGRPLGDPPSLMGGGPPSHAFGVSSPRPPPAPIVIELRPEAALALRARAGRDLVVGVTVAVALMLAAAVFWRLSRRAQVVEAHLGEQRHLAALGEMSAVLAHEIRNPLASLKGHAQLLAERVEGDPALSRKVARIVDESQRLEALTHGLLDFARQSRLALADVDPAAVLRRCADAWPDATIEFELARAPARWRFDAAKLERVLGNLIDNADQAAPGRPIRIRAYVEGQRLVFEVHDRGPGVRPSDRARIFEPFHTTRTRGTGLGLAVSRRIVEQHGGTIEVLDAPGGGACFRVALPREPSRGSADEPR